MSTQLSTDTIVRTNEQLFRTIIDEGFTNAHLAVFDDIISPDIVEHQFDMCPGPDGVKRAVAFLHRAFPDFRLVVEDLVADGDKIWGRLRATGTHTGPGLGGPGSGKRMDITVFDICRFQDGKMIEHWGVPDRFAQLHQLGLFPRREESLTSS